MSPKYVQATDPEAHPWWRRKAHVTRRATGWGYWINGLRQEDAAWSYEQARAEALNDLDTFIDD